MAHSNTQSSPWQAYGLGLLGVLCFAATLPLTEIALADFSPWFITAARAGIAGMLAVVVVGIRRRPWPERTEIRNLWMCGLCLAYGFPLSMALGLQTVPAYHGGIVLGILPLATAGLSVVVHGYRARSLFWVWAVLGSVLVSTFAWYEGEGGWVAGDLWLVAAAFFASYGYVLSSRLSVKHGGWWVISWSLIVWLPVSAILSGLSWPAFLLSRPLDSLVSLMALAVFSMYLGFFAWNQALAMGGVARIGQVQLFQVFLTLFWSAILLDSDLPMHSWWFAIAVMITVYFGRKAG